jgi:methionyl-tRNA formyltransferase
MNILFMGTPDFAVPCLERLPADEHTVSLVVTQPDKPKGRGYQLTPPPVKVCAEQHNLPVYQPDTLKTDEVYERLREVQPDVIVVVAYGKILPERILSLPRHGCINVHASLLPKYRGAAPIQWAIMNGETESGVTTIQMDKGIDTGDMLLRRGGVKITPDMTGGELHDILMRLGADVLSDTLKELEAGTLCPEKQDDAQSGYAPMLTRETGVLDFTQPAKTLHNRIRGLSPWPIAACTFQGKRLQVFVSRFGGTTDSPPGTVVSIEPFAIACGDGISLILDEVRLEGGKQMKASDFLRGHPVRIGEKLE